MLDRTFTIGYNQIMKKRIAIIIFAVVLTAALSALTLVGCNKTNENTVSEYGISMNTLPQQYYVQDETFSSDGGSIRVGLTETGDTGVARDGFKIVSLSDPDVKISYPGTAIAGEVKTAIITYHGLKTSYKYYVATSANAIESVTFSLEEDGVAPSLKYAVTTTDLRSNADFNDLIMTVKYRESTGRPDQRNYVKDIPFASNGVYLTNFDPTKIGKKTMSLNYLATQYDLDYEVVKDDWIERVDLSTDGLMLNYFVGGELELGNSAFTYYYNSGKVEKKAVTAADVNGFSSEEITASYGKYFAITDAVGTAQTFNYKIYDASVTSNMKRMEKYTGLGFLNYLDKMSYDDYMKANVFRIFLNDTDFIEITGDNENLAVTKKTDNSSFDAVAYAAALTKGQQFNLVFTYGGNNAISSEVTFTVAVLWKNTAITGWQNDFTVAKDGAFNFGEAKLTKIFEDGSTKEFSIQEEFEKKVASERAFSINGSGATPVYAFDTSKTGSFETYYISVVGTVTVNGEEYNHNKTGRLYISYTVI